jgi:hypothetical protein
VQQECHRQAIPSKNRFYVAKKRAGGVVVAVVVAGSGVSILCGKQPTWVTHRLRWVLDPFDLTFFLSPDGSIAEGIWRFTYPVAAIHP